MKLALLKGNRLNAWHMAVYECAARQAATGFPLEITAFVAPDNLFDIRSLDIRTVEVPYEFQAGPRWRRLWARWQYNRLHSTAGYEFAPYRLEEHLSGFDLIQTWETFTTHSRAAVRAASKTAAKVLVTVWDDLPHDQEHLACKAEIKREVRSSADGFLVYTQAARQALLEEGVDPGKIYRLWPSVDLTRFDAPVAPPAALDPGWLGNDSFVILFAGRFVPEKGIHDLLEAVVLLAKTPRHPRPRLIYIGSGSEQDALQRRIEEDHLEGWVRIMERQPYGAMPAWLRLADVVVLPSRHRGDWREQFGMIALEALAAGRPVIASRTPGMQEMLEEGAILFEAGDVQALRQALEDLALAPRRREELSGQARKRAMDRFDQNKNAHELLAVYRHLLGPG